MIEDKETSVKDSPKIDVIDSKKENSSDSNHSSPSITPVENKDQVNTPTKSTIFNFFTKTEEPKKKKIPLDQISTSRIFDYQVDLYQLEVERPV